MEIINASRAKKLNSQITGTSYYDFLANELHGLEPLICMDMQRSPPSEKVREDPLGPAMDSAKYYDVDDNATEWYLGTRALPVKNPLDWQRKFCCNYRQRRHKATSYSVPGRRVSPEFLSLLKQHHARTRRHLPYKCRRPKVNFAYYKYDAEGKRRHMRPGIDTAAPLEFMDPMEQSEMLVPGQEMYIESSVLVSPRTKRAKKRRVRSKRDKLNQDKIMNAKDLKWLKVDGLGFPSTPEETKDTFQKDLDNEDNLQENIKSETSVPKPPNVWGPLKLKTLAEQLARRNCPIGLGIVPNIRYIRNKKDRDSRLIDYFKAALVKAFRGWEVYPKNRSSKQIKQSQCSSDDNCGQNDVCKKPSVSRSQGTESTNKTIKGILQKRSRTKASAFDSDFHKKKVCIENCKYRNHTKLPETNPNGSNINPGITEQEESRFGEEVNEQPNFSGNSPDNSERPFPCKRPSCLLNVEPSSGHHCRIKSKKKKVEIPSKCSAVQEEPKINTEIQHTFPCSEAQQRIHPEEDPNFLDIREDLTKPNPYGSKINPENTAEENARHFEKTNLSCNSKRSLSCKGSSWRWSIVQPSSGYHLNINQSNLPNRQMECKNINTNPYVCKINSEITGQSDSRLSDNPYTCTRPPCPCKRPSCSRTVPSPVPSPVPVSNPRSYHLLKAIQSMNKHLYDLSNSTPLEMPTPKVVPNFNNRNTKKRPIKPPATKKAVDNEQIKKCVPKRPKDPKVNQKNCCLEPTKNLKRCPNKPKDPKVCQKNCCLAPTGNLRRCPNKPIVIRCNPETKICVPFPHSSGNERTDFIRWLYPRPNSGRRKKYTKTRKTPCKATWKCHQSDTSLSCDPCRVQQHCCRCPCCSSVVPCSAFRGQEARQRSCPHKKRWHCKPTCQENSQGSFPRSCEQTKSAPTVSKSFTRCCGSGRMRGGVDFQEDDYFIPGRNRDVAHSFCTKLFSDSDSYQQIKNVKHRKWSKHAFSFD